MITREIAVNGLKGRRRMFLLLVLVLAFTFLFLVAALLLESSMTQTRQSQRQKLYGTWHAAYLGADADTSGRLLEEPAVTAAAISEILGKDIWAGTVGSFQPALAEIGNLHMVQGRYPEASNEVLIESHVADALGLKEPVGSALNLTICNSLCQAPSPGQGVCGGSDADLGEQVLLFPRRIRLFHAGRNRRAWLAI